MSPGLYVQYFLNIQYLFYICSLKCEQFAIFHKKKKYSYFNYHNYNLIFKSISLMYGKRYLWHHHRICFYRYQASTCVRALFSPFGVFNIHPLGWSYNHHEYMLYWCWGTNIALVQKRLARSSISRRAVAFETLLSSPRSRRRSIVQIV